MPANFLVDGGNMGLAAVALRELGRLAGVVRTLVLLRSGVPVNLFYLESDRAALLADM